MIPCISQATTLTTPFAADIAALASGGCMAVEIWLTKLEKHLETATVDGTRKLLAEREIVPAAAAYQGGLLLSQGEARAVHFEHFRRRLDLCQGLGIPTLILVADFVQNPDQ